MKKITTILLALVGVIVFVACNKHETYADQVEAERKSIESYIKNKGIKVISEEQFQAAGETTDTAKNEYVLFESSGVCRQILRKAVGEKIKPGEKVTVLCRFSEWNLNRSQDSIQLSNEVMREPDMMYVSNTSGTFTGTFDTSSSMYRVYSEYSKTTVPTGWLLPLSYIYVGRVVNVGDELAKVRIIVPHDKGQEHATRNVYPTVYEITYQRGR